MLRWVIAEADDYVETVLFLVYLIYVKCSITWSDQPYTDSSESKASTTDAYMQRIQIYSRK